MTEPENFLDRLNEKGDFPHIPFEDAKRKVGKGWAGLLDEVYSFIPKDIKVETVKEKFGLLRIYTSAPHPHDVYTKLGEIERKSGTICEECGTTENVTTERFKTRWYIKTLCQPCRLLREL